MASHRLRRFGQCVFAKIFAAAIALAPTEGLTASDPLAALERRHTELFGQLAPGVVFISAGDSLGSGFFVGRKGLILTNAHVVDKRKTVRVVMHDARKFTGKVIARAKGGLDLALVRIPIKDAPTLNLAPPNQVAVGGWVGTVGHGMGGIWAFNSGHVTNSYPLGKDLRLFQTQIPVNPGNSGGPVFDRRGRVLGIVTAGITGANSINLSIEIGDAISRLPKLAAECECLSVIAPKGVPIFVDGKMVGVGPKVVLPMSKGEHDIRAVVRGKKRSKTIEFPRVKAVQL